MSNAAASDYIQIIRGSSIIISSDCVSGVFFLFILVHEKEFAYTHHSMWVSTEKKNTYISIYTGRPLPEMRYNGQRLLRSRTDL